MHTTLNRIREHNPCKDGWETLLKYLGKTKPDDEPLPLLKILDSNGLNDALWCFRAVAGFEKEKLLLGITYAREVEHLMPAESKKALDVFERYANGLATEEEFEKAAACAVAARANVDDVAAAWDAAWDAARAAEAACAAADADAYRAAAAAARAVSVADVVRVAAVAAVAAAAAAARSPIKAKQENQLRELLERTK